MISFKITFLKTFPAFEDQNSSQLDDVQAVTIR